MSKLRLREWDGSTEIAAICMGSGLKFQDCYLSSEDIDKVDDYVQDDFGNLAVIVEDEKEGEILYIIQSIDVDFL